MDLEQISTAGDFILFLRELAPRAGSYAGSLEEYLRAVHRVTTAHQDEPSTWRLLAQVLADALSATPASFDPAWLEATAPPEAVVGDQEAAIADPFAALQQMLRYQIADLHRMAEIGTINNPYRSYGIDSPTGHRWYNFEPQTFLECASAGETVPPRPSVLGWIWPSSSGWDRSTNSTTRPDWLDAPQRALPSSGSRRTCQLLLHPSSVRRN